MAAFTEIQPRPASGPGALPHEACRCTRCGMELASTMPSLLRQDMAAHAAYHDRVAR